MTSQMEATAGMRLTLVPGGQLNLVTNTGVRFSGVLRKYYHCPFEGHPLELEGHVVLYDGKHFMPVNSVSRISRVPSTFQRQ